MAREKRIKALTGYPFFGWTPDSIREYIETKPLERSDLMIIYNGHGGFHHYMLAEVENPNSGRQRCVILSKAGHSGGIEFHRTGKNQFSPKGQSIMLPPVPALMEHLSLDCDVILDLPPYA